MAYILFYADGRDFRLIREYFNQHPEIAFIVPDGKNRWRATLTVPRLQGKSVTLWHVPSGPLPLLHPPNGLKETPIRNPWKGWKEIYPQGGRIPFFADPPGIIMMDMQPRSKEEENGGILERIATVGKRQCDLDTAQGPGQWAAPGDLGISLSLGFV